AGYTKAALASTKSGRKPTKPNSSPARWTGQREGDLLRLPWSSYGGSHIRLRQSKGGKRVTIRVRRGPGRAPRRAPAPNADRARSPAPSDAAPRGDLPCRRQGHRIAAQIEVVGAQIGNRAAGRTGGLGGLQRRLDDGGDARRHLILKLEDIFERAVEAVDPQ